MNYFEHHIGDYAEATAHLSFVEDAAYSRLIRKYYAQEKPLPVELKSVQRLVAARTKEEKEAVESVLKEFFELQEDGWHNKRCDAEIERYREKVQESEAAKANEQERQRRHREERKSLFEQLRERGIVPKWDTPTSALRDMINSAPVTVTGHNGHAPVTVTSQPVTPPVTPDNTATQTPNTKHHIEKPSAQTSSAPKFSAIDFLLKAGADRRIAADWLKVRKEKRLAPTQTALEDVVAEVEKSGLPLNEALKLCCVKGWGGFKAKWPRDGAAGEVPVWEQ
jgi:uncharacterized protein YdaU (DUF1376 family)